MAVDYFLKLDGVPGESKDDKYKDWIEVLSFSWATARGGPKTHDFQVVKATDKASPLLAMASCNGKSPGQAMFVARKSGSTVEYLKIKLTDVIISSYNTAGNTDDNPVETVTLNFTKAEFQVASQTPTGAPGDYVPGVCEPGGRGSNER